MIDMNMARYRENYDLLGYNGSNIQDTYFDRMDDRFRMVVPLDFQNYETWTDRELIEMAQDFSGYGRHQVKGGINLAHIGGIQQYPGCLIISPWMTNLEITRSLQHLPQ